jgi:hypothetical protein
MITGVVVGNDGAAVGVRRAVVTLSGPDVAEGLSTITDDQGQFLFGGLASGKFRVAASKPGYLSVSFGSMTPGTDGTEIVLSRGSRVDISLKLPRGAAITGEVVAQSGEPLSNAAVWAIRKKSANGWPSEPMLPDTFTDEQGKYRVFGLPAGEYLVAAQQRTMGSGAIRSLNASVVDNALAQLQNLAGSVAAGDARSAGPPMQGSAPMYYPGTADYTRATLISLVAGGEYSNVNFAIGPVEVGTIQGTIRTPEGQRVSATPLILGDRPAFPTDLASSPQLEADPNTDFRFVGVAAGRYRIFVKARSGPALRGATGGRFLWALQDVEVRGANVENLGLTLQPSLQVRGRLQFNSSILKIPDTSRIRIRLTETETLGVSTYWAQAERPTRSVAANASPDGTFLLDGLLPGQYRLEVDLPSQSWNAESALMAGVDYLDHAVTLGESDLSGLVLTLSDVSSSLSGSLLGLGSDLGEDVTLAAFPANPVERASPRRVRTARPATDGSYDMGRLPPGNYLIAVLRREVALSLDALENLATSTVPFVILPAERKVLNLSVKR